MERLVNGYFKLLRLLIVLSLAAMVIMVFANVVLRYAFNSGISITEELSRWMFVWLVFLGSIEAVRRRAHIGFESVVTRLPPSAQKICLGISLSLMLMVVIMLLVGTVQQIKANFATQTPVMEVSLSYLYVAAIPFCLSVAVILAVNLWRLSRGTLSPEQIYGGEDLEERSALRDQS